MKRAFYAFILAAGLLPPSARCETERMAWGAPVPGGYDVWGWISAYTDEDQGSWEDLGRAKQDSAVEKAGAACKKADARLAATKGQTDGKAILSLSGRDLEYIGVCLKDGEDLSEALSAKRAKLAEIQAKAAKGAYEEADMQWLRANGITLEHKSLAEPQTAKQKEERAKNQEKTSAAAGKKYGKMKGMNADGLAGVYDGAASGRNAGNDGSSSVDLSAKKSAMGSLKLEARGPKKELTSLAPPVLGGGGGPAVKTAPPDTPPPAGPKMEAQKASSAYDYKLSKIGSSKAMSDAQGLAQDERKVREGQVGVAIATREEHEKITKSFINHSGIGGAIPVLYDFAPGGVAADCITGKCTDGSGAWGKVVQIVSGTPSKRAVGEGYYTKTEIACAGLADIAGDLDALTFGLTKKIPLPSACNRPNGSK